MSNINDDIYQALAPSDHRYTQAVRQPAERLTCDDCGTEASIDGNLPVDMFQLDTPVKNKPLFSLCLGDLASRRALGQTLVRRG